MVLKSRFTNQRDRQERRSHQVEDLILLAEALFQSGCQVLKMADINQLIREYAGVSASNRTIRRHVEVLVRLGWVEPFETWRQGVLFELSYEIIRENFPFQRKSLQKP
jgi:Fe2+ or Zn2+ uptake regulation protein